MKILFVSNNFPPEVNALATRTFEHGKEWVKCGAQLEVITDIPNYPEGEVYKGYENKFSIEEKEGIRLIRVPMYIAENKGSLKRILSYVSFMLSAIWFSRKVIQKPDIIVASSPQFFTGIAGYIISKIKRKPFVLEIRDLWPESIVAVGAMKRNFVIRLFERIEIFLYRKSDLIIVVTDAFKIYMMKKGIDGDKIHVIKNGADISILSKELDREHLQTLRKQLGWEDKFIAAYIGTIGMAHRADILLEAAQECQDSDIIFVVMGTGAERKALEEKSVALNLSNFRLLEKQPKEQVPYYLALSDVAVVHLKNTPLFKTVIPSKIFEAMVLKKPIVLGVDGETRAIVEDAGCGIYAEPENVDQLVKAVEELKNNKIKYEKMASSGFSYVQNRANRQKIAREYLELLDSMVK